MAGEWPEVRLADICREVRYGYTTAAADTVTDTRLLRVTDITNGNVRWDSVPFCEISDKEYTRYRLETGDIVIARMGTIGASAFIKDPPRAVAASYLIIHRVDPAIADSRFVSYVMRSPYWWSFVWSHGSSGAVQPNINARVLGEFQFALPPLPEQRAIAHILGTLDDKIELNRRLSETLEQMARALFKAWFVDFEPVRAKMEGRWRRGESLPGLPTHLYDLFPDRLVDSELGEIPEGWGVGTLGDVADHIRRNVQPGQIEPQTPYIALEHMPRRCIALSDWGAAEGIESNKFEFRKGEILFGKLRPYFHKVGVAPVDGVCSTDIVVVAPKTPHWFAFVLYVVSSDEFVEYTNAGSTGTKMPRTSWVEMARYDIVLPPEAIAQAFTEMVRPGVDRIIAATHESRTLAALRDTLLPMLISGALRVTDAERFLEERGV